MMGGATQRLMKERDSIQSSNIRKVFRNLQIEDSNSLIWTAYITPEQPPYNKGAFKIEITFPLEYPFKPPKLVFKTRIYHPNIDEKGQVCLPIITAENWKPATKMEQVIQALVALIQDPEFEHPLCSDIADEYAKDPKKFMKNAEAFTLKYAEKLPAE